MNASPDFSIDTKIIDVWAILSFMYQHQSNLISCFPSTAHMVFFIQDCFILSIRLSDMIKAVLAKIDTLTIYMQFYLLT